MSLVLSDVRLTTATVSLRISMWRGFKTAKEVGDAGADALSAASGKTLSKKQVRSSVRLIDEGPIKALEKEANQTKAFWRAATLPWDDDGTRIVTTAGLTALTTYLDERKRLWLQQTIPDFAAAWPQYVRDASFLLGPVFNPNLYPSQAAIPSHFGFVYKVEQIPDLDDFRLNGISQADLDAYKANTEATIRSDLANAQKIVWERLREPIAKMIESLSGYTGGHEGKFSYTLVDNVAKVCDLLPGLNIGGDPMLEVYGETIKRVLCSYDAKDLRKDEGLRAQVIDAATLLHAQMDQFV